MPWQDILNIFTSMFSGIAALGALYQWRKDRQKEEELDEQRRN